MPRRPRLFESHVLYDVTVQTVDREFLLKPPLQKSMALVTGQNLRSHNVHAIAERIGA